MTGTLIQRLRVGAVNMFEETFPVIATPPRGKTDSGFPKEGHGAVRYLQRRTITSHHANCILHHPKTGSKT